MPSEPVILLAIAAVMLYASSRAAAQALGGTAGRAVGHFLPIVGTALVATVAGLDPLAINVLFAATAMEVTLVIGVSLLSAPLEGESRNRRTWAMFLPVAAVAWMAGSIGAVDYRVAAGLFVVGAIIAWMRSDVTSFDGRKEPTKAGRSKAWPIVVLLAVIVAIMGALAVVLATQQVLAGSRPITQGMLASTVIAPLLVLPILGAASELALYENSSIKPVSIGVWAGLLNLCLGLPAIMLARLGREHYHPTGDPAGFPIPYGTWRFDAMVLVIVGLLLAPIGLGRWSPGRLEGIFLVLLYVMYLYLVSPLNMA